MEIRRRLMYALLMLLVVTAISIIGYILLGRDVSFLQALYMAVITLAGVGYGEIIDTSHNPALRVFNMFVVLFGVTITVYVFSVVTAFLVEGEITNIFWRRKMEKHINQLKGHYIVCGLGDTGRHALEELQKTGTPYVVVESHEDNIKRFREQAGNAYDQMLYIIGDATDDSVLEHAGVAHARGLIAALSNDKDNLVITVMVRQQNPGIRIVARCIDPKFSEKMVRAGANSTVSPNRIGGLRMASEVLRPHVVNFLDLMLKEQSHTLRIEEIDVSASSPWTGATVGALDLRRKYNLIALAVRSPHEVEGWKFLLNPPDDLKLAAGCVVIVMGDLEEIRRARQAAQHEAAQAVVAAF